MAAKKSETALETRVFISYSRRDLVFADQLDAALRTRGVVPLLDRSEVYAFEDWWRRILIAKSDTVIFVLSPDAVSSEVCRKEIEFAASLNKRFVPIVARPVDVGKMPETLRRLNFVFFDGASFDAAVDQLVAALSTDIEWIRRHTELGELGRRWSEAGKSSPQRRNVVSGALVAGLVVAFALAGLAYWQREIAVERCRQALLDRPPAPNSREESAQQRLHRVGAHAACLIMPPSDYSAGGSHARFRAGDEPLTK